jgi:hypothetical protein
MNTIYVFSIPGAGLGNTLFQIATAIYYCEKYGYTLELLETNEILYGSSNLFGKVKCIIDDNNIFKPYTKTIFSKIVSIRELPKVDNYVKIMNDSIDQIIIPDGSPILIFGFCNNIKLSIDNFPKMFNKYLCFDDQNIKDYIRNKYGDISNGICLGVRIGSDFEHMKKIQKSSYLAALEYYKIIGVNTDNVYIISDTPNYTIDGYNCIDVNEADIIQFYIGILCKNYILSESTFHLWIAYMGTCNDESKKVICFNDTDITNRSFNLNSWIKINY